MVVIITQSGQNLMLTGNNPFISRVSDVYTSFPFFVKMEFLLPFKKNYNKE